jgi:dienelactone hydrolase
MYRAFCKTGVLLTLVVLVSACGPATTVITPTAAPALPSPTSTPVPFPETTTPQPTKAASPTEPEPAAGSVAFSDSGQELGDGHSTDVALGDLDGDGDLDAMVGNEGQAQVWLNDGQSGFSPNGQGLTIPSGWNMGLDLGDLDGDGDLDAFIVVATGPGRVLLNQGGAQRGIAGSFADSGQQLMASSGFGFDLDLGDIDGDGDLDAYVAHERANLVWLNDGQGGFQDSGQRLGEAITADVALADLDGDGDLDALAGGWDEPARVWLNDGRGTFANSGHILTAAAVHIHGLDVGDLDGDGDLDAFLALASGHPNQVWFNDGQGVFSDSGQQLPSALGHAVVLGDLDGDGDLDAFVANAASSAGAPNTVWLNDGQGNFGDSGLRLGNGVSYGVDLGDLDRDGDLDAFVANNSPPNAVWLNGWHQAAPPSQAIISASPVSATPVPPTATPVPPTLVPTALPGALMVAVPPGNPPALDGTLSLGEWDSARREKFSDGSELLLMQNGGYLYLGIRAAGHSIWSVFLDRGDEIAVLHTSGSLGTAVYKRTESDWQPTRTFAWTLQDKSNSETARQQRKQFLETEGWLASLGTMGKPEEVEFQLAMPQGTLRLAVAFPLPPNYAEAALWPAGLDDDVRTIDLLKGNTPAQLRFSLERWGVVTEAAATGARSPVSPSPSPQQVQAGRVSFVAEDGMKLSGTMFMGEGAKDIGVVLAHMGAHRADQRSWTSFAQTIAQRGFGALTFNFRADRSKLDRDVRAAVRFLRDQGYQRIVCMGASMGGTASLKAAVDTDLAGVVVISSLWTTGSGSTGGALRVSREDLAQLTLPKLFVTTDKDGNGVPATMKAMYEAAPEPKALKIFPGTVHGTDIFFTPQGDEFRDLLVDFLEDLLRE